MSDKANLTNAELELTQRIQMHFPRGIIYSDVLKRFNGCSTETITKLCVEAFSKFPEMIPEPLLEFLGIVTLTAITEKFVVREKFMLDVSKKAHVKISYLGDNFTEWFLGKTEEPFGGSTLRYGALRKPSVDNPIIIELGGEVRAETSLAEMFAIMEVQPDGKAGVLLANGYANIFYIRDINGVLRAVHCYWVDGGWDVIACSVEDPIAWLAGVHVFSRNPSVS